MLDFFFYGTLLDDDVRMAVLGRSAPGKPPIAAVLIGFRRVPVVGHSFPVLIADPRGRVEGALLTGIGTAEAARISFFEGPQYRVLERPVTPADGAAAASARPAWLFVPAPRQPFGPGLRPRPGVWELTSWQRRHKPGYMRGVRQAMGEASSSVLAELRQGWEERARPAPRGQAAKSNAPRPSGSGRALRK